MKKKVLLIGGAGFIGLHIVKHLTERGDYDITIADNFFRGRMDEHLSEMVSAHRIRVVEADLTEPAGFRELDDDYDYVYMLASVVGVEYTSRMPHEIFRINTALILNTLEWLKQSRCKKTLFTSTSECYAGTIEAFDYDIPTPETAPLCIKDISHPRFTYAVTKMLGESGFHNYSKAVGFENVIVRYHNIYGPRMGFKHVIPHLAQRFLSGEDPFSVYCPDQTRSFCYITDAARCTVLAMEHEDNDGATYHIGSMEVIAIEELVRYVGDLFGFNGAYVQAPTFPGYVSRRCPDITKARIELGYEPQVGWKEGVGRTIEWYKNYLKAGYEVYE